MRLFPIENRTASLTEQLLLTPSTEAPKISSALFTVSFENSTGSVPPQMSLTPFLPSRGVLTVWLFPIQRSADIHIAAGEDNAPRKIGRGLFQLPCVIKDSVEYGIHKVVHILALAPRCWMDDIQVDVNTGRQSVEYCGER